MLIGSTTPTMTCPQGKRHMDTEASRVVFEDVEGALSGPLRGYLQRLVGDRATAEDLLQETLLKIARGLSSFEGRSTVKTWAFTIATRVATDHFRRPQNRARMIDIDETSPIDDAETEQKLVESLDAFAKVFEPSGGVVDQAEDPEKAD